MYKSIIRPLFFKFSAEQAHHIAFTLFKSILKLPVAKKISTSIFQYNNANLAQDLFGLHFPNPIGLAAGFDKDAKLVDELETLGFGFIEIGTVTPEPQAGNPQPRLFRLAEDRALINRMGFNNEGMLAAADRLKARKGKVIIGGNIGKNKLTPNEEAISDYEKAFDALYDYVDYFVINVSSPNTPNLRALQEKEPLKALLMAVQVRNKKKPTLKPVLLKIAPDLTESMLDDILEIVSEAQLSGIIATNTTISRENLITDQNALEHMGAGGLSGKPLQNRSTEVVRYLYKKSAGTVPIIAAGGIMNGKDAMGKLQAGASLVQVYTGFVYEGPGMIKRMSKYLAANYYQHKK